MDGEESVDLVNDHGLVLDEVATGGIAEWANALGGSTLPSALQLCGRLPLTFNLDLVAGNGGEHVGGQPPRGGRAIDVGAFGEGQEDLVLLGGLDDSHTVSTVALEARPLLRDDDIDQSTGDVGQKTLEGGTLLPAGAGGVVVLIHLDERPPPPLDERIPAYIERIAQRDPFSGRVVTGGIVTAEDSSWLLSWTVDRQPHFKKQPKDQIVVWVYGLFVDVDGDYVKKPLAQCTGEEITQEWLYHLGVPVDEIPELAATGARCVPVMRPYVTSQFMPRRAGDRPQVVPEGAANFAFLGQFAETGRDTIFTTEYSVRTGMEAVYELLDVERGVPETWGSTYDVRDLLEASAHMRDGKKMEMPGPAALRGYLRDRLEHGEIGQLLEEHGLI